MRLSRAALAALPLLLCSLLTSCHNLAIPNVPITTASGNWIINPHFEGTETPLNTVSSFGGSLVQDDTQLSGVLHIDNPCFGNGVTDIPYTGTLINNAINITSSPVANQVLTLQGKLSADGSVLATASVAINGGCSGNLYGPALTYTVNSWLDQKGERLPNFTGSWATPTTSPGPGFTEQLTQSSTPDTHGDYALTGTVTFSGSPCFTTGTLQSSSFVSGPIAQQVILMDDGSKLTATVQISPSGGFLAQPLVASMILEPIVITGGNCNGTIDIPTLSPQP